MKLARTQRRALSALLAACCVVAQLLTPPCASGYILNYTVADMRQPGARSGGSACPQPNRLSTATAINRRWSTSLSASPATIFTLDASAAGRLDEIEAAIRDSFAAWTGVGGSALRDASLAPLARTIEKAACSSSDGLNSICLNQDDPAFTPGVLAFTRVVTADTIGEQLAPGTPASAFVGQILDADILFRPNAADATFATPQALPAQPNAYDLESVLTHELGHFFGFAHSGVWSAMMYPFVPPRGQFLADRPTAQSPDAPLADDDRTGVRVLYPDPADALFTGSIRGRILPANPLALASEPPGVTGMFGAHVIALDADTGAVVAAALAGWSCSDPGPPRFDGSYALEHLPVGAGRNYKIYVEPLDGPVDAGEIRGAIGGLCRNSFTDAGWPAPFACVVPDVNTNFTTRMRPAS